MRFLQKKSAVIYSSVLLIIFLTAGLVWYFLPANQEYEDLGMRPGWNITENIYGGKNTTKFAARVEIIGSETFLPDDGPYTVFVPTDEAYDNLPAETLAALKGEANRKNLREVLLFHVVHGKYLSSDFKDGMKLTTVQGEKLTITKEDNYWVINGYSYIEMSDIASSNGVIHLATNYLIPESMIETQ